MLVRRLFLRGGLFACLFVVLLGAAFALDSSAMAAVSGRGEPPPGSPFLPASFTQIGNGPAGGTLWQGEIPNGAAPAIRRPSIVYLPPAVSRAKRYPTLYVLHGMPGDPNSIAGMDFVSVADRAISSGAARPFIAVIPPAGADPQFMGEWAGIWEQYLVDSVVPWADRFLPTLPVRSARTLAGLSGGGYGAADIGLRHPLMFGTLESWSGYFRAPADLFPSGGTLAARAAHDPTLLVSSEAALLRRLGTRFYISSGSTGDAPSLDSSVDFIRVLAKLGLPRRSFFAPGGHDWRFWDRQLPVAIDYALGPASPPSGA